MLELGEQSTYTRVKRVSGAFVVGDSAGRRTTQYNRILFRIHLVSR